MSARDQATDAQGGAGEPVAWVLKYKDHPKRLAWEYDPEGFGSGWTVTPLYAHPPVAAPEFAPQMDGDKALREVDNGMSWLEAAEFVERYDLPDSCIAELAAFTPPNEPANAANMVAGDEEDDECPWPYNPNTDPGGCNCGAWIAGHNGHSANCAALQPDHGERKA